MIITGFMLPYAGVGQLQGGRPEVLTVHISSREGAHVRTSNPEINLPPEGKRAPARLEKGRAQACLTQHGILVWMASAPGNDGYRSSHLLFIGWDAATGQNVVASFAALRSSNAQLLETPMLEYQIRDDASGEDMEIESAGGGEAAGRASGTFRRGRRLAGRCVILAVNPQQLS
mmetsp:Transcript_17114/g.65287  ORF Transcript_17114/g.65287 Transcript_17114/m.65287 type:complete len:174 (-) Transcript_17114:1329-1850(-)